VSGGNKKLITDDVLVVGDKVDMVTNQGVVYRTMIEDRLADGTFLAGVPNRKGVFMSVGQGDDVYVVFYRESGRYIAQMRVVALETRMNIRYMWLIQRTQAQKNQRREAYRLPIEFEVEIYDIADEMENNLQFDHDNEEVRAKALETVMSRDLSMTGIAIVTRKKYELNDEYLLELYFDRTPISIRSKSINNRSTTALTMTAAVKRCIPWRTGNTFDTGMHFLGATKTMSDNLAKYVLNEQQKQIKRRRRLI